MDLLTIGGAVVGMASGIVIVLVLRKEKSWVSLGVGGPIILLGVILLAIFYGLISGILVWLITAVSLAVLGITSYATRRKTNNI